MLIFHLDTGSTSKTAIDNDNDRKFELESDVVWFAFKEDQAGTVENELEVSVTRGRVIVMVQMKGEEVWRRIV